MTGQGFGGGLAKGSDGQQLQGQNQGQRQGEGQTGNSGVPGQHGSEGQWGATQGGQGGGVDPAQRSNYEGWNENDSMYHIQPFHVMKDANDSDYIW